MVSPFAAPFSYKNSPFNQNGSNVILRSSTVHLLLRQLRMRSCYHDARLADHRHVSYVATSRNDKLTRAYSGDVIISYLAVVILLLLASVECIQTQ